MGGIGGSSLVLKLLLSFFLVTETCVGGIFTHSVDFIVYSIILPTPCIDGKCNFFCSAKNDNYAAKQLPRVQSGSPENKRTLQ